MDKPMLKGWAFLIIMTIIAGACFYTAEYILRHWVFTALGYIATASGWYYYGIEHGWFLRNNE